MTEARIIFWCLVCENVCDSRDFLAKKYFLVSVFTDFDDISLGSGFFAQLLRVNAKSLFTVLPDILCYINFLSASWAI